MWALFALIEHHETSWDIKLTCRRKPEIRQRKALTTQHFTGLKAIWAFRGFWSFIFVCEHRKVYITAVPIFYILADDMGLGKTLTMISLVLQKKHDAESGTSSPRKEKKRMSWITTKGEWCVWIEHLSMKQVLFTTYA